MGARPAIRHRAAIVALTIGFVSALGAAPAAAWGSGPAFNVANISVRYGSGVVQQTITLSGDLSGGRNNNGTSLIVDANSDSSGLVTGLNVSPATNGACIQLSNSGTQNEWVCTVRDAGTLAVLVNTGSATQSFPPGTGDNPNAVTTTITDSNNRAQASGTVSLLAPVTPSPTPPTQPAPKPSSAKPSVAPSPSRPTGTPSSSATATNSPSPTSTDVALTLPSNGSAAGALPTSSGSPPTSFSAGSTGTGSSGATTLIVIGTILLALGLALIQPFRALKRRLPAETPPWEER